MPFLKTFVTSLYKIYIKASQKLCFFSLSSARNMRNFAITSGVLSGLFSFHQDTDDSHWEKVCFVFLKLKRFKKKVWIWSYHLCLQWKFKFWQKSLLEVIRQNIAGCCQQTFENKKFVDITQAILLNIFYIISYLIWYPEMV